MKSQEAKAWLRLIRGNVKRLKELTEKYPAYISYCNRYYILTGMQAVKELYTSLVEELRSYGEDVGEFDKLIIL